VDLLRKVREKNLIRRKLTKLVELYFAILNVLSIMLMVKSKFDYQTTLLCY